MLAWPEFKPPFNRFSSLSIACRLSRHFQRTVSAGEGKRVGIHNIFDWCSEGIFLLRCHQKELELRVLIGNFELFGVLNNPYSAAPSQGRAYECENIPLSLNLTLCLISSFQPSSKGIIL